MDRVSFQDFNIVPVWTGTKPKEYFFRMMQAPDKINWKCVYKTLPIILMAKCKTVLHFTMLVGLAQILVSNKCKRKKRLFIHFDPLSRPCITHHLLYLFSKAALNKDPQALLERNYLTEGAGCCQKKRQLAFKKTAQWFFSPNARKKTW